MSSTLLTAIGQLQAVVGAVAGIRRAPDTPPEKMSVFPFSVAYVTSGTWKIGPPELKTGLHNIVIEIHVSREQDLGRAIEDVMEFSESVPNAIFSAFKAGTLTALQTFDTLTYTFGPLGWAGIATVGWRFTLNTVKMQSEVT